jgi:DNA-binding MarR family transcriptional regulator
MYGGSEMRHTCGADDVTLERAKTLVRILPAIMRQLFAGSNDPTAELPLAQLRVCSMLHQGARPMSSLSREIGVTLSALTQIADRLERSGLVCRVAEENDRRVRCLQLTPQGEYMMELQTTHRAERVVKAMNRLSPEKQTTLLAALESLLEASATVNDENKSMNTERVSIPNKPEINPRAMR